MKMLFAKKPRKSKGNYRGQEKTGKGSSRKARSRENPGTWCVYRTPRHIYAQLIAPSGSEVVASASTLDKEVRNGLPATGNVSAAQAVGEVIAKRAVKAGVTRVAFDRSGYKYHGRIKALADAAREHGLQF